VRDIELKLNGGAQFVGFNFPGLGANGLHQSVLGCQEGLDMPIAMPDKFTKLCFCVILLDLWL
jgi:hypothetical protein